MKFMMMMHHQGQQPFALSSWSTADFKAHIGFMMDFAKHLTDSGELLLAEGLAHPDQAKRVHARSDGEPEVDGVFPETKEFLVGFWLVEVDTPQRAYALAAQASAAPGPGGAPLNLNIEVRQVMSAPPRHD